MNRSLKEKLEKLPERRGQRHVPQCCDQCGKPTELVSALEIYGQPYEGWEWYIRCTNPHCMAYVETKPGTMVAAGRMSSPKVRRARIAAHHVFDATWKPDKRKRSRAYEWLAKKMKLPVSQCHIIKFDMRQCQQVIELVKFYKPTFEPDTDSYPENYDYIYKREKERWPENTD